MIDPTKALEILSTLSNNNVSVSIDLSTWSNRVWQYEDLDDSSTVIRMTVERYYSEDEGGFYKPTDYSMEDKNKISITCYVVVPKDDLPQASREKKLILPKNEWRVWGVGELDIKISRLVENGPYLEARMCRFRGSLRGSGITNLVSKVEIWEEEDVM